MSNCLEAFCNNWLKCAGMNWHNFKVIQALISTIKSCHGICCSRDHNVHMRRCQNITNIDLPQAGNQYCQVEYDLLQITSYRRNTGHISNGL